MNQRIRILTCPSVMGEDAVCSVGFEANLLPMKIKSKTTAEDTKRAVRLMVDSNVDLISFVGGDGTARDILDIMPRSGRPPVLGIPSGVKMYSGIFAFNPEDAAYIVEAFVREETQLETLK